MAATATISAGNPLADTWLTGWLVRPVDAVAEDIGITIWLRQLIELAVVAVIGYVLVRLLIRKGLPWLGARLAEPAGQGTDLLRAALLLPDLAVSKVFRAKSRRPPEVVHVYGSAVMVVFDAVRRWVVASLGGLSKLRRTPSLIVVALLLLAFLTWNSTACPSGGVSATCRSPVSVWTASFTSWINPQKPPSKPKTTHKATKPKTSTTKHKP